MPYQLFSPLSVTSLPYKCCLLLANAVQLISSRYIPHRFNKMSKLVVANPPFQQKTSLLLHENDITTDLLFLGTRYFNLHKIFCIWQGAKAEHLMTILHHDLAVTLRILGTSVLALRRRFEPLFLHTLHLIYSPVTLPEPCHGIDQDNGPKDISYMM